MRKLESRHNPKVGIMAESSPTPDVKPIGPPSAPRIPQFTVGDGQLTLSWQTPSSDGGSAITRHEYITKVGSNGTWPSTWIAIPNSAHDGANATSFVVTPLNNGTEYTFQIRAVNDVDAGASVTTASATPASATTVPEAPTSLKAIPSDTKVFLSWEPPANNGGEIITKYQYQHKLSSANTWSAWSDVSLSGVGEANEKSTTVSGFTNGVNYIIQLRAVNTRGNGIGVELASSIAPNRPSLFRQKFLEEPSIVALLKMKTKLVVQEFFVGEVIVLNSQVSVMILLTKLSMQPYLLLAKESHRGVRL